MKNLDPVYKTAEELKITEQERDELIASIPYFLALAPSEFRMIDWSNCICGHVAKMNGRDPIDEYHGCSKALDQLYGVQGKAWTGISNGWSATAATPSDAALAIVRFLS